MGENVISYDEAVPIDGYGPGNFRIAGQLIQGSVLVLPTKVLMWDGIGDTGSILNNAEEIDIVFIGTGAQIAHLPENFTEPLHLAGIGVEPMTSPSACRMYNILVSEGRRIACALLPI